MEIELYDYPTRYLVHSESVTGDSYLVDLTHFKVGEIFNGSCTCPHFSLNLISKLRNPENKAIHRCKHLRLARENCLDFILPKMKESDPNKDEHP